MFLPQQQSTLTGARVVLVDYPPALEGTATADATGTATITWDPPDIDYFYRIERATTFVTGSTGGTVALYEGYVNPIRIRDGSTSPAFDVADESSPITIHPSMAVIMQWTGLTPGARCSASLQYTLWRTLTNLTTPTGS